VADSSLEPALVRWTLRVATADLEIALVQVLDAFPDGFSEEVDGDTVVISGYLPSGQTPPIDATPEPVPAGWREAWRAFHRPVVVGPFWLGPPWIAPDSAHEAIVIEPALAFGTGAHGSTRAALELLVRDPAPRGALLDIGCGSGVLAIAAARLGHAPVTAFDHDPHAVAATRENAAVNGVAVEAWEGDALADVVPDAPLQLANLQLELLVPLFARGVTARRVIVSGLLEREAFAPAGYLRRDREVADGWQALLLERLE
jgi:ribosomal protein L11 methyltransferase